MNHQELDDLVLDYLSGGLDGEGVLRLEQALEDMPEGGRRFAELAFQESLLLEMGADQPADAESPAEEPEFASSASSASTRFRASSRRSRAISRRRSVRRTSKTRAWLRYGVAPLAAAAAVLMAAHFYNLRTVAKAREELCAEVIELRGRVEITNPGGAPVRPGGKIEPGGRVSTGSDGRVKLRYRDKSTLEIKEKTLLTIQKHEAAKRIYLETGQLSANVTGQPADAPIILGTPHAEAKVIGTRFALDARADRTRIEVEAGTVRLTRGDKKAVDVDGGHYAVAGPNTKLLALPISGMPQSVKMQLATAEDAPKAVDLSAAGPGGGRLRYEIVLRPEHGRLSGAAPKLTYTPEADYHGPDGFTFRASDGVTEAESSASITVAPVNDPPQAQGQALAVKEDTPLRIILGGSDPEGDPLRFGVESGPAHGKLVGKPPELTYVPEADYAGRDAFAFRVDDGKGASARAQVTIRVSPVNDPPVARITAKPTRGMVPLTVTFSGEGSSDPEGKIASYRWNFADDFAGSGAKVEHVFRWPGSYRVQLTVRDEQGLTATSEVRVTVDPDPNVIKAPGKLTGHYGGRPRRFLLTWRDNSDNEEGFHVERAQSVAGKLFRDISYERLATLGPNATSCRTKLTPTPSKKGSFVFRIRAFNTKTGRFSSYSYFFVSWDPKSTVQTLNWPPPGKTK